MSRQVSLSLTVYSIGGSGVQVGSGVWVAVFLGVVVNVGVVVAVISASARASAGVSPRLMIKKIKRPISTRILAQRDCLLIRFHKPGIGGHYRKVLCHKPGNYDFCLPGYRIGCFSFFYSLLKNYCCSAVLVQFTHGSSIYSFSILCSKMSIL